MMVGFFGHPLAPLHLSGIDGFCRCLGFGGLNCQLSSLIGVEVKMQGRQEVNGRKRRED
jgi:hypothetical protein